MTDEQQTQKWCPFAIGIMGYRNAGSGRVTPAPSQSHNRIGVVSDGDVVTPAWTMCIGAKCSAWRLPKVKKGQKPDENQINGYCGLAGKP